jgi:hypothetical protein
MDIDLTFSENIVGMLDHKGLRRNLAERGRER